MSIKTYGSFDLTVSQVSEGIAVNFKGPISIQNILSNVRGTPKYSLQVSNDKDQGFVDYNRDTSGLDVSDSISINYTEFPWKYIRIEYFAFISTSGLATLKVGFRDE